MASSALSITLFSASRPSPLSAAGRRPLRRKRRDWAGKAFLFAGGRRQRLRNDAASRAIWDHRRSLDRGFALVACRFSRGRLADVLAGVLLGVAMLKPTIAGPFFLVLLVKRRWLRRGGLFALCDRRRRDGLGLDRDESRRDVPTNDGVRRRLRRRFARFGGAAAVARPEPQARDAGAGRRRPAAGRRAPVGVPAPESADVFSPSPPSPLVFGATIKDMTTA